MIRQRNHIPVEGRRRQERGNRPKVPAITLEVFLLKEQSIVAQVTRLSGYISRWKRTPGIRLVRNHRLLGENGAFRRCAGRRSIAHFLADARLQGFLGLKTEKAKG